MPYGVTATDDTNRAQTWRAILKSGSIFPIRTTTVNCTATDSSGNESHASFNVHVKGAAEQLADLRQAVSGFGPGAALEDKVKADPDRQRHRAMTLARARTFAHSATR